jgi:hypothetical protein
LETDERAERREREEMKIENPNVFWLAFARNVPED